MDITKLSDLELVRILRQTQQSVVVLEQELNKRLIELDKKEKSKIIVEKNNDAKDTIV